MSAAGVRIEPLTPERWSDLERLFGPNGACAGCWCMWWRLRRKAFDAGAGEDNRAAFKAIVATGPPPASSPMWKRNRSLGAR